MKKIVLIIVSILLLNNSLKAQSEAIDQSFRPVFALGVCASQIDGDTYSGYKHLGLFIGAGINRQLTKAIEVEFMLTLIQKGVRSNYQTDSASLNNPNNAFSLIRLNYLEIPLYFRFGKRRFKAEIGGAVGYLIQNPPYNRDQYGPVPDAYNRNWRHFDGSFLIGLGYKIKQNWFINLRFEYSMVPVSPYPTPQGGVYHGPSAGSYNFIFGKIFNKGLYNNCLTLTLNYRLPIKASATTIGAVDAK